MRPLAVPLALGVTVLAVGGCGGGAASPSADASEPPTLPTASPTEPPSEAVSASPPADVYDQLVGSVVQVEATGTFRWPFAGREQETGRGSGFIVDPSGIVVTNNHVVTGADSVTVWVGPDRAEHTATVLGASECSDLAAIRIDGGPFPALDWYQGEIEPGLPIYAAGYPLGEPEFTLYRGIVSRAHGIIDEYWASVDNSIEHDANINPGSSGGPVVTDDVQVVGVNYAGDDETRQSFAISREEALPILEDLEHGKDVTSIGINGMALGPGEEPTQGIWVASVKDGSVASRAGILPGDVVTELDGHETTDGTLKAYCEVLRSHEPDDQVPFEVFRDDSREELTGELNGDAVEPGFAFAAELGSGPPADASTVAFDAIVTDSPVSFEAPVDWGDSLDQPWSFQGTDVGRGVVVSRDVQAFKDGWRTPGVFVALAESAPSGLDLDGLLDAERARFEASCDYDHRGSFARGGFSGRWDLWTACGGGESRFLTVAAEPESGDGRVVYLQFQAASDDDLAVLDRVLATLEIAS